MAKTEKAFSPNQGRVSEDKDSRNWCPQNSYCWTHSFWMPSEPVRNPHLHLSCCPCINLTPALLFISKLPNQLILSYLSQESSAWTRPRKRSSPPGEPTPAGHTTGCPVSWDSFMHGCAHYLPWSGPGPLSRKSGQMTTQRHCTSENSLQLSEMCWSTPLSFSKKLTNLCLCMQMNGTLHF